MFFDKSFQDVKQGQLATAPILIETLAGTRDFYFL